MSDTALVRTEKRFSVGDQGYLLPLHALKSFEAGRKTSSYVPIEQAIGTLEKLEVGTA